MSPAAISAASMTNVPDPHMGSTTGSLPSNPHWRRNSDAMVSRIGALATACLWPRLCNSSPEVSTPMVQTLFSMRALTQTSASGEAIAPSSSAIARSIRCAAAPE